MVKLNEKDRLLTESEALVFLGISRRTLLTLRSEAGLPHLLVGGQYRYQREALIGWAAKNAEAHREGQAVDARQAKKRSARIRVQRKGKIF